MKHIATLLLAAALAAGAGFTASASPRTVTVTGTGRIAAEASSASFSAYVETTADTQQEAAAENARRTRALREALLATGPAWTSSRRKIIPSIPSTCTTRKRHLHPPGLPRCEPDECARALPVAHRIPHRRRRGKRRGPRRLAPVPDGGRRAVPPAGLRRRGGRRAPPGTGSRTRSASRSVRRSPSARRATHRRSCAGRWSSSRRPPAPAPPSPLWKRARRPSPPSSTSPMHCSEEAIMKRTAIALLTAGLVLAGSLADTRRTRAPSP